MNPLDTTGDTQQTVHGDAIKILTRNAETARKNAEDMRSAAALARGEMERAEAAAIDYDLKAEHWEKSIDVLFAAELAA